MLSVVYLHGTYPPSRLWGLSEVQNLAKRDRPSILWGGGTKGTETLDRLAVVVHQMPAACTSQVIKSDGQHGSMQASKVADASKWEA